MKNNIITLLIIFFELCFLNVLFSKNTKESRIQDIQADYIIIYPEEFYDNLYPLVNLRQNQGLVVYQKSLEEIYAEYVDTLSQEIKIQYFISNALEFWQNPKPKYLLLVGDTEILPSFKIPSSFNGEHGEWFISLDEIFAINIYEEDIKPDIAIGRLPVIDNKELSDLINKIIHFESDLSRGSYTKDFLFLSDTSYYFQQHTMDFIETVMPENYTFNWINLNQDSVYSLANEKFMTALNQNPIFLMYNGHGKIDIWADSLIFTNSHIHQLSVEMNPLILTSIACSQRFDSVGYRGISENMLLRPTGGAVAVLGSAGLLFYSKGTLFINTFYSKLFRQIKNIGDLILETKRETNNSNHIDDSIARFTLLGDPALRIPDYLLSDIISNKDIVPTNYIICRNYPNPFNKETTLEIYLPESGNLDIQIFNIIGEKVDNIHHGRLPMGIYRFIWKADVISSGMYIAVINFEGRIITEFMTLLK